MRRPQPARGRARRKAAPAASPLVRLWEKLPRGPVRWALPALAALLVVAGGLSLLGTGPAPAPAPSGPPAPVVVQAAPAPPPPPPLFQPEADDYTYEPTPLEGVRLSDPPATRLRPREAEAVQETVRETPITPPPSAPAPSQASPAPPPPQPQHHQQQQQQHAALPPLGPMGSPAWQRHAVPAPEGLRGRGLVAVVIDDMGIDLRRTRQTLALPGPLTLSYLTYASALNEQLREGMAQGHEVMIHVPMQPKSDTVDPGPGVLTVEMSPAEVKAQLQRLLDPVTVGVVGINNHMGSRFTESQPGMAAVMEVLAARGLFWLDSGTTPNSAGPEAARRAGVPNIQRHVFLDHEDSPAFISGQLARLEQVAQTYGHAVAIGHPRDHTIAQLAAWLPTLEGKGLSLVPLTTLITLQETLAQTRTTHSGD